MRLQPLSSPVIIGGGPAGAAAAIRLAQAGHAPMVLERNAMPAEKVCGDFVGGDAIGLLRALGVEPARLGAAPVHRLRLVHRHRVAEASLPFPACGLSRRVLDAALLQRATAAGAIIRGGMAVRRLARCESGWRIDAASASPDASAVIAAPTVFLATGKHDLRDHPRPGVRRGAVGLKTYLRLAPPQQAALAGAVELFLFPGGYAGLQAVEDGRAVLCAALRHGSARPWPDLMAALADATPLLRQRLTAAEPLLPRPLAVAGVPYGLLLRTADDPGLYRLGDQAAVIPSLAGDGIAIALHSGLLAAGAWLDGSGAAAYHHRLATSLATPMRLAGALHAVAMTGGLQAATLLCVRLLPPLLRGFAAGTRIPRPGAAPAGRATRGLHPA